MPTNPYDDILGRLDELNDEQRQQLLEKLQTDQMTDNGSAGGRSLLDAFQEHGMVGSITDAPADWSTNPQHLEGFGKDAE